MSSGTAFDGRGKTRDRCRCILFRTYRDKTHGVKKFARAMTDFVTNSRLTVFLDPTAICVSSAARRLLKPIKIIPDGHGEGEELFERLAGLVEGDGDAAGFEDDAWGEVVKLLGEDAEWGLDQHLRPFQTLLLQLRQNPGDLAAAADLVMTVVARGQAAEVGNQGGAIGQAIGADVVGDRGREDLLGAAAADAEEKLHRGPVDEGAREGFQFSDNVRNFAIPGRFSGHGIFPMLVRTSAKCNFPDIL
jgi:hypothetical protein